MCRWKARRRKLTREQKPYCEMSLADACDRMTLRVWSDHPDYKACSALAGGDFIELDGEFAQHQQFGLEARKWKFRTTDRQERCELLPGPAELRAKQAADWQFIMQTVTAISDPRLRGICECVSEGIWRTFSSHRRGAQLSSRAPRRTGRAHRANDARGDGDRAALSATESRSSRRRNSFSRFRKALGKSSARRRIHHGITTSAAN